MEKEKMFEDFDLWKDYDLGDGRPFIVACRDREAINMERWVLVSLSEQEAKSVYEFLHKYFK